MRHLQPEGSDSMIWLRPDDVYGWRAVILDDRLGFEITVDAGGWDLCMAAAADVAEAEDRACRWRL